MTFLPIVQRELRVRARQKSTHRFRLVGAVLAIGFVIFMLLVAQASSSRTMGQPIFTVLAWLAFAYCLLGSAMNTADCLSEEKRAGTLGLLFLTDLKGYDVVLGKLMATSLNSFYAVLAIFPPLAIPILVGGVTGGEFWRLVLVLINTLFFSLCAGLFVSAISRDEQKAWGSTVGLLAAITFLPLAFQYVPPLSWLEAVSPGVGFISLFDASYCVNPDRFRNSLLLVHLQSWGFLIAASVLLPRVWQEEPPSKARGGLLERVLTQIGIKTNQSARWGRGRARLRLGDTNPVTWMALKQQRPPLFIWIFIGVVVVAGLTSWWLAYRSWYLLWQLVAGVVVFHFVIAARLSLQSSQFFAQARSSGALELLLCTPLQTTEIVDGYRTALERVFAKPVVTLLIVEWVIVTGNVVFANPLGSGDKAIVPTIAALCLLLLATDLYAAAEYGMWVGLSSRKTSQSLMKTTIYLLILPALSVFCCFWPLALIKNLILINYVRDQLRRRFRIVAAEQFSGGEGDWDSSQRTKRRKKLPSVFEPRIPLLP